LLLLVIAPGCTQPVYPENAAASLRAKTVIGKQLPILLADSLSPWHLTPSIDSVTTNYLADTAVVLWHAGQFRGLVVLENDPMYGSWFWKGAASSDDPATDSWTVMENPGTAIGPCENGHLTGPPSADSLYQGGWIDEPFARRLKNLLVEAPATNKFVYHTCDRFSEPDFVYDWGGARASVSHENRSDTPIILTGGLSDSAAVSGGTSIYTLTISAKTLTHAVLKNSILSIWFPYVLSRHSTYVVVLLTNRVAPSEIGGSLRNNVLSFKLPPMVLPKGAILFGTVVARRRARH
jgi:hypothetical protein